LGRAGVAMGLPSTSDLIQFKEVPLGEATPKGRDAATGLPTLAGGRYVRERRLGEGSAGKVNLYRRVVDGRLVAGKVVSEPRLRRQQLGRGTSAMQSFTRELAVLQHLERGIDPCPYVARVREVLYSEASEKYYILMDYADLGSLWRGDPDDKNDDDDGGGEGQAGGRGLGEAGAGGAAGRVFDQCLLPAGGLARGRQGIRVLRRLGRQALMAVEGLHARGVVHGDLKPHNFMLRSPEGEALGADTSKGELERLALGDLAIVDFGACARFELGNPASEMRVRNPGTFELAAPECLSGEAYGGRAADVWALGATLFYAAYGRLPFRGAHVDALFEHIAQGAAGVDFPDAAGNDAGQAGIDLRRALEAMFSVDVAARPTAAELLASDPFFSCPDDDALVPADLARAAEPPRGERGQPSALQDKKK